VVIATYNRLPALTRLLRDQLADQTLSATAYEVVVVDDGSAEKVREPLMKLDLPYQLRVEEQANAGAAAARHRGVLSAQGDVVLITDDDMQVGRDFLERHLERHPPGSRTVVLGHIRPDPNVSGMPLFERWGAWLNDRLARRLGSPGGQRARGHNLYTGNVSFNREDYIAAGGFDSALRQSEDIELGVRLEKLGCTFEFSPEAYVLHGSDHTSLEKWLKRAHRYGVFDTKVAAKHPDVPQVNPWRLLFEMNPLARPFLASAVALPRATRPLTSAMMVAAEGLARLGLERVAYASVSVAYTMEYLRGAREEAGGWSGALKAATRYGARSSRVVRLLQKVRILPRTEAE
jgi:GT2 family glycosyltransferase